MSEELNLVTDLAIILIAAGVFTIISKALKQPLILGYIIAGFLVSPHLGLLPNLTSVEAVNQWSEIGIIFLLFALGLEFSFKKLMKVGSSSLITCMAKCLGMFIVGLIVGNLLGWTTMESIFLGGLMGMSSTTIIIKAYEDLGLKKEAHSSVLFGSLVIEDIVAVILLVLLSTLAVSNKFAGGEMLLGIGKLVFFLILWFLIGIFVLPTFMKKAKKFMSDEILLIVSIGLCFGMVVLANIAGFSSALGAFVMGSLLSETIEGEKIEHLVGSIKDLFGAIFFVSVGMMVDPAVIGQHWGTILVLTIVTMIGILFFATGGALLAGQGLEKSLKIGFSLPQLGEFAFIIASLGCSLGVMRDFIYPVIIAISVITTFTTPYMIKAAGPAYNFLLKKLPVDFLAKLSPSAESPAAVSSAERNEWKELLKSIILRTVLYGVILLAIMLGSSKYLEPFALKTFTNLSAGMVKATCLALTLIVMLPFLYGIGINSGKASASFARLVRQKDSNKWPLLGILILRIFIAVAFVIGAIVMYVHLSYWVILLLAVGLAAFFFITRRSMHKLSFLEDRFTANFNEKEEIEKKKKPVTTSVKSKLENYDVQLELLEVSPDSNCIGKRLREMPFRKKSGINIVKIVRGSKNILIPSGDEVIYPKDSLLAVGTKEQIEDFKEIMSETIEPEEQDEQDNFIVKKFPLTESSFLTGKTLREAKMRAAKCMVISVLKGDKFITNPKPDDKFEVGDIVWIAGEKESCEWFI